VIFSPPSFGSPPSAEHDPGRALQRTRRSCRTSCRGSRIARNRPRDDRDAAERLGGSSGFPLPSASPTPCDRRAPTRSTTCDEQPVIRNLIRPCRHIPTVPNERRHLRLNHPSDDSQVRRDAKNTYADLPSAVVSPGLGTRWTSRSKAAASAITVRRVGLGLYRPSGIAAPSVVRRCHGLDWWPWMP
jgi:hypothetical protein